MMNTTREVKLNDHVRYIGKDLPPYPIVKRQTVGSVIRIYDDILTEYGNPVTHLVRFEFDGDLGLELVMFDPNDLEVVER